MKCILVLSVLFTVIPYCYSIYCYSCDSSNDFSCAEFWDPSENQQYYQNCSKVYNANYCVKMTGVYDGKLGTKRFCSSRDWGDYCEYIQRPGDPREYRSCVFTCTTHGCNKGSMSVKGSLSLLFGIYVISYILK